MSTGMDDLFGAGFDGFVEDATATLVAGLGGGYVGSLIVDKAYGYTLGRIAMLNSPRWKGLALVALGVVGGSFLARYHRGVGAGFGAVMVTNGASKFAGSFVPALQLSGDLGYALGNEAETLLLGQAVDVRERVPMPGVDGYASNADVREQSPIPGVPVGSMHGVSRRVAGSFTG